MDDLLLECLNDLETALQWLELPYQQRPPEIEFEKCRSNLAIVKARLDREKQQTPLKWLNLPTGIYNPLMRAGFKTIESIAKLAPKQLMSIPGIGANYKDIIIEARERWHLESLKTPCLENLRHSPCSEQL